MHFQKTVTQVMIPRHGPFSPIPQSWKITPRMANISLLNALNYARVITVKVTKSHIGQSLSDSPLTLPTAVFGWYWLAASTRSARLIRKSS